MPNEKVFLNAEKNSVIHDTEFLCKVQDENTFKYPSFYRKSLNYKKRRSNDKMQS
jgi:DNA-directed RNA polymerase alpha subunit